MSSKRSLVHPNYEARYRIKNSAEYDCLLIQRGRITFWFSDNAMKKWKAKRTKKQGTQAQIFVPKIQGSMLVF